MSSARLPHSGAPTPGGARTATAPPGGVPASGAPGSVTKRPPRVLSSSRYRHPGDVIRLITGGLALAVALAVAVVTSGELLGPGARTVRWLGYDPAGRLLVGVVQVAFVLTVAGVVAASLRYRRFRLLAGLAAGAVAAGAALTGILLLAGGQHPHAVAVTDARGGWLASAAFRLV